MESLQLHPSEIARLEAEISFDPERLAPVVAPGSTAEAEALARIDQARDEEMGARLDSFERRQARATRYWRRHAR
jgi:hypothetical protein